MKIIVIIDNSECNEQDEHVLLKLVAEYISSVDNADVVQSRIYESTDNVINCIGS